MVTKTITVTGEAYELLSALKRGQESFSHLFTRLAKEKSVAEKYFGILKGDVGAARERFKKIRAEIGADMQEREHALFGHQRGS